MKKVRKFKCISRKGDNTLSVGFEVGEVYEFLKEDCNDNTYFFHIGGDLMWGDIEDFEEVTEEESLQLKVERLKMELKETENTLREKEKYTRVVPIEELKETVWYTYTDVKGYLVSFTDVVRGLGYGFSAIVGNWVEEAHFSKGKLRCATEKEVETILFRIAKQKGFVEGVKFSNAATAFHGQNTGVVGELKFHHLIVLGLSSGNQWIMWKGKWSTPIKEETYKVGDYVVLTSERPPYWNSVGKMDYLLGSVVEISDIGEETYVVFKKENDWKFLIKDIVRKATSKDIESVKPKLPKINGYEGHLADDGKYLVYGCAILPINWFIGSKTRYIKNLTLSSGVEISTANMDAIRAYLEYKKC